MRAEGRPWRRAICRSDRPRIVFSSKRDGDFEIYLIDPDGGDIRQPRRPPGSLRGLDRRGRGPPQFTPDTVWRGIERGFLWWRRAPSLQGPEETRPVLEQQKKTAPLRPGYRGLRAEAFVPGERATVVGVYWISNEGERREPVVFQVVEMRNGKIAQIQDYRKRASALKAAGAAG